MVLVQIHALLHFEHFISLKTTYIFCFIVLQTLISIINPRGLHLRFVAEEIRGNILWIILIWFC